MNDFMGLDIAALLEENQRLREENRFLREENQRLREENQSLRELVARQQEQIAGLVKRIETLEEQLAKNSSNSSKPPSQDPPSMKRPAKTATGRTRGGQIGHKGVGRKMLPLDQVDHVVEVKPEVCQGCGERLKGDDEQPGRHQVVELPEIRPEVTEYRIHELICPCCGERTIGEWPAGVPTGAFGVRLMSAVAILSGVYRISRRKVACLLSELFGVEMGTGSVSSCEKQVSRSLEAPVEEALIYAREQSALNVDETSWRESGRKAWLWVATSLSGLVTVFMIHAHRSQEAAKSLLGTFAGILISDRYSAYTPRSLENRQACWSHLRRDFKAMSERSGDGGQDRSGSVRGIVSATCRQQKRNVLTFLIEAVEARLRNKPAPSLLPFSGSLKYFSQFEPLCWPELLRIRGVGRCTRRLNDHTASTGLRGIYSNYWT